MRIAIPAATRYDGEPAAEMAGLYRLLQRLRRRYGLVDLVWGLSSHLWLGAAAAVAVLVIARLVPVAGDGALAVMVVLVWLVVLLGCGLRPMTVLAVARRADRQLGLKDRLATAVVFAGRPGDQEGREELVVRQRRDALAAAEALSVSRALPLRLNRARLALAAALGAAALLLTVVPNPQHEVLRQRQAVRQAAQQEAQRLHQLRRSLESNQAVGERERRQLEAALARLEEQLKANRGRAEQALADVAAAEGAVRPLRDRPAVRRGQAAERLVAQLDRLARESGGESTAGRKPGSSETAAELSSSLASQLENMTDQERRALADRLAELARGASANLPEAAQALAELSEAVQAGDAVAAAASLAAAQSALSQAAASAAGAQAVEGALAELQQTRQAIAAVGSRPGAVVASAPGGAPAAPSGAAPSGQGSTGQPADGPAGGMRAAGRQGQGAAGGGQAGAAGGGRAGAAGGGQAGAAGGGQAGGAGRGGTAGGSGSGAGGGFGRSGEGSAGAGETVAGGGGGEYEPVGPPQDYVEGGAAVVYAPGRRGTPGRSEFIPARGGQSQPGRPLLRRRQTASGGVTRPALVPYEEVYTAYERAAGQVLQRQAIPLRLRDYVRQYFAQLEP